MMKRELEQIVAQYIYTLDGAELFRLQFVINNKVGDVMITPDVHGLLKCCIVRDHLYRLVAKNRDVQEEFVNLYDTFFSLLRTK